MAANARARQTHCVCHDTICSLLLPPKSLLLNNMPSGLRIATLLPHEGRTHMQLIITFMAVVAGLVFSVAVALLVEEMIFGQVFRLFFTPQPVRVRAERQPSTGR